MRTRFRFRPRRRGRGIRLSRRQRAGLALLAIGMASLLLFLNFSRNLEPVMTEMAVQQAYALVTRAINASVDEKLQDGSLSYHRLITLERDETGNITALTTDVATVNSLQTSITGGVLDRIGALGRSDLSIPLGNILGGNLLSGRGPGVRFRVVSLGNPTAEFINAFSEAGINQTKHQIMLEIAVAVNIMVPGNTTRETIRMRVLVAETIIVGDVPAVYGQFRIE